MINSAKKKTKFGVKNDELIGTAIRAAVRQIYRCSRGQFVLPAEVQHLLYLLEPDLAAAGAEAHLHHGRGSGQVHQVRLVPMRHDYCQFFCELQSGMDSLLRWQQQTSVMLRNQFFFSTRFLQTGNKPDRDPTSDDSESTLSKSYFCAIAPFPRGTYELWNRRLSLAFNISRT